MLPIAIVGAGNMAREHIRAFASLPGVAVAGITSRTRGRAEALAAEFEIRHVCDSIGELYRATGAVLCVSTVFETAMRDVAIECCRYPWTVLLEKPPGIDLAAAEEIGSAAKDRGRTVLVGLNRRFLSATRAALNDLAMCPGPRFIHVQDQQSLAMAHALNHPPEVVERWMFANSIHLADYLRCFGRGTVNEVQLLSPPPNGLDVVLARVVFSSGDVGVYEAVWDGPGPWAATVTTSAKRWELRPLEQARYQKIGERRLIDVAADDYDVQFKPGFKLQAEHAVAAACGLPNESTTLDEALETMRLIQAIYRPELTAAGALA